MFSALAYRGRSSVGRAPALHAGGQEFDPPRLHHFNQHLLLSGAPCAKVGLYTPQSRDHIRCVSSAAAKRLECELELA
jgi:hypothetical protein